jgi:DNA-binding TFAR19-related protein (PDSD5 family)
MDDQQLAALKQMNAPGAGGEGQGAQDDGKREAEEQMRRDLLATVLDSAARERREP